ncbi:MAG: DNA repair protein RecN [Clostridiales bacterium]|nr:DNA repair protein RecN [Clostridiales bacterium]
MLSQLYIKNIAVIKEAGIDFTKGFNVFTGETGAGKTILVNAINAVLGERTSKDIIRTGENSATISAVFDEVPLSVLDQLAELGYELEPGESLLIMRTISADGKTQCKINGQPATVSMLRTISGLLINVHGQHDSQQLMVAEKHLGYVDLYGGLQEKLSEYQCKFAELKAVDEKIGELSASEAEKAHKTDLLTYQIGEITAAELQEGEEEDLISRRRILRNSEKITQSLGTALMLMNGEENGETPGALELLDQLGEQLGEAGRYVPELEEMATAVNGYKYELEEYASSVQDRLETMDYDPGYAEYIESRLDTINTLKRKYGPDIPSILNYLDRAKQELDDIIFADEKLAQLEWERSERFAESYELARQLSQLRHTAAEEFVAKIQSELEFLDMSSVRFLPAFKEKALSGTGMDEFELFVSTNVGEEPKPLAKIASGGELSRIMLAMKNVLADRDAVGTMIFDEIDTGVSGRAAQKIGKKLKEVSSGRQVICVTHLAQVAAFADNHLLISKKVRDEKTFTSVSTLDPEERVGELARIMGGDIITPATLEAAQELIKKSL